MKTIMDDVQEYQSQANALDSELELVIHSYKQAIDGMEQVTNELNEALFSAIRSHVQDVEAASMKDSLSTTNSKIKVLSSLCRNINAMEDAFTDLKSRYARVLNDNYVSSPEDVESEHTIGRSLEFGDDVSK